MRANATLPVIQPTNNSAKRRAGRFSRSGILPLAMREHAALPVIQPTNNSAKRRAGLRLD